MPDYKIFYVKTAKKLSQLTLLVFLFANTISCKYSDENLGANNAANPAPFFSPVLQQIRDEASPELIIRLPADMPSDNGTIIPITYSSSDNSYFAVIFTFPHCPKEPSCNVGRVFVSKYNDDSEQWLKSEHFAEKIPLTNGIEAILYDEPTIRGFNSHVVWQQDEFVYGIIMYAGNAKGDNLVHETLESMASSMSTEPPFK